MKDSTIFILLAAAVAAAVVLSRDAFTLAPKGAGTQPAAGVVPVSSIAVGEFNQRLDAQGKPVAYNPIVEAGQYGSILTTQSPERGEAPYVFGLRPISNLQH